MTAAGTFEVGANGLADAANGQPIRHGSDTAHFNHVLETDDEAPAHRTEAEHLLRRAVAADPNVPAPRLALAAFLLERLRYVEALDAAAEGVRRCPSSLELRLVLARIQFQMRRYADAANTIETLLAIAPQHAWAWYELGKISRNSYERLELADIAMEHAAAEPQTRDAQAAASALGVKLTVLSAVTENDFDQVFASFAQQHADALLVSADPFFSSRREHLVALAARHAIPTLYEFREFVEAGGLVSYGTVLRDGYYKGGNYVARILKGAKPADLPVEQIDKFELVINATTAEALGLTVPDRLLALADEVIQ
jgi:tetratricopeptide (TPR) repeat protein